MPHRFLLRASLILTTVLVWFITAVCDSGALEIDPARKRAIAPERSASAAPGSVKTVPLAIPAKGRESRFTLLSPEQTGVDFTNRLDLDHRLKRLYLAGFACGGVAVGDIDGDGRADLYLVNGPHENRLYRQSGNLHFTDVTEQAGVSGSQAWGAGAAMIDIDNDGDLDIYVANYNTPNQLFVNEGNGRFREAAADFGLDLIDACLMPAFCDYDRDGDLDVYVLTYRLYRAGGRPRKPPFAMRNGRPYVLPGYDQYYALTHRGGNKFDIDNSGRRDYLLRNNGDGTFSNVSSEAGINKPGHGLSVTWWDYNHDGWPDVYVGNDFNDPDHLYRNMGDGTFTDALDVSIPHTSWFSMGADFGDLNDDGRFDLLVADMSATSHYSQKTTMGAMNANKLAKVAGPPPQLMKNALYLSSGMDRFFEAAELAGLADSDWTWAIKLADFDNDGRNDVFISNGIVRSINHSDHLVSTVQLIGQTEWDYYQDQPPRPEQNLAYRNMGDLKFEDVSQSWGLNKVSMSYAAAYADLDRDGDLDLIVANLDEPVSIYRNDSSEGNRLLVELRGTQSNRYGLGATVTIETSSGRQLRMLSPQTGFLSANEPIVHFGLGAAQQVDQLTVEWPSGRRQTLSQIGANQLLTIHEPAGEESAISALALPLQSDTHESTWYRPTKLGAACRHIETEYDDFARQPLLPNKLSQLGPGIAIADYDGDGDDDFYFGGAANYPGRLMVNQGDGKFRPLKLAVFDQDKACEDMGAVWFDFDGDGDFDLYVASGGVEGESGASIFRDRLYLNDGAGRLAAAFKEALPDLHDSGSAVAAADFDRDGDLDLFVGSRVIPGDYPTSPTSRLLENRDGKFADATARLAPGLMTAGLVTGALWSDADGDGWLDLLLTTEWGPVRLLQNVQGKLVERTDEAALAQRHGWWNGIAAQDLDGDGDIDYVVTNFGLNTKYHATMERPIAMYYGDFDGSGSKRLVEAEYEDDTLFPIRGKSCSTGAMPHLAEKFQTYHQFALASIVDIYTPKCLTESEKFSVTTLESGVLINNGDGTFAFSALPRIAQIAPSFGAILTEVDGDGHPDLYLAQNFFSAQPETGRMDGGMSLLLLGNGNGTFRPVTPDRSGLVVPGDATAAAVCDLDQDQFGDLLVAVNDENLLAFEKRTDTNPAVASGRIMRVELKGLPGNPRGIGARVTLQMSDGRLQAAEVCAGHGYLSQSTHVLSFGVPYGHRIEQIKVRWPDGLQTIHAPTNAQRQIIAKPNKA